MEDSLTIATAIFTRDAPLWRLEMALKSRYEQTRKPDEIMVIDESSTEEYKKAYQELFSKLPFGVKFIEYSAQDEYWFHPAHLCNIAIANTDCDYVVFGDIDGVFSSNALEVLEQTLQENPDALCLSKRLALPKESDSPDIDFIKDFEEWKQKGKLVYAPGSFQVIPVEWAKQVGGFDESIKGWGFYDSEIVARAEMDGKKVIQLEDKIDVLHIWHKVYKVKGYTADKIVLENKRLRSVTQDTNTIVVNKGIDWRKLRHNPVRLDKTRDQLRKDWEAAGKSEHFMTAIATGISTEDDFEKSGGNYINWVLIEIQKLGVSMEEKRIVEVGCGAGRMTQFFMEITDFVYATDVSMEMLYRLRERLDFPSNVALIRSDGLGCIPDEEADIIFSLLVFQHNPEDVVEQFFKDGARVLKPGGHYVFQLTVKDVHEVMRSESGATDMVRWTKAELEELAIRYGYEMLNSLDDQFKVWRKK